MIEPLRFTVELQCSAGGRIFERVTDGREFECGEVQLLMRRGEFAVILPTFAEACLRGR